MTNFTWIDGSIVGMYLLATMTAGIMVRKYVARVDHFLVAGREMNVYLGIASLAATEFGIVTCMYTAQAGYTRGFSGAIPGICNAVAMFVVGWTGFCVKPLRDSGAITIPELFEQRYGKFVRWLSGVVIVLGGLLNMGVFLRVGGQFLVVCCGLNLKYLEITMTVLLVGVAVYTIMGGMLSVLVTDFLQFIVMSRRYAGRHVPGSESSRLGSHGRHGRDTLRRGGLQSVCRQRPRLGICAVQPLHQYRRRADLADLYRPAAVGQGQQDGSQGLHGYGFLLRLPLGHSGAVGHRGTGFDRSVRRRDDRTAVRRKGRHVVCHAVSSSPQIVPAGMMGVLVAAMLAADMSTDSSYMLTWGSVIYNDILAPFRRTRWSEKRGILWNRCIVAFIGMFLLFWGLWYKLEGNLWEYLQTTGAIYLASMSVLLIACCYWKRANNWGAIAAIIVGAALPVLALSLNLFFKVPMLDETGVQILKEGVLVTEGWAKHYIGDNFVNIGTFVATGVAMVVGSLLKPYLSRESTASTGSQGDRP